MAGENLRIDAFATQFAEGDDAAAGERRDAQEWSGRKRHRDLDRTFPR
jgi:hypothetical protein